VAWNPLSTKIDFTTAIFFEKKFEKKISLRHRFLTAQTTPHEQFNIDQTAFTTETLKDSMDTARAFKDAHGEMKKAYGQFNISELEDLHDDMADLMEDANEIQEVLARSYGVDEDCIDEDELDAELAALEGEMAWEAEASGPTAASGSAEGPAYLSALDSAPTHTPAHAEKQAIAAGDVDEFGLPRVAAQTTN
jgi:charged multivesicular body protein 5